MKEPRINKANYTVLLKDAVTDTGVYNSLIHDLRTDFSNKCGATIMQQCPDLYNMFLNKWRYYEINEYEKDEDDPYAIFKESVTAVYEVHCLYYVEKLKAYYKQYDYASGLTRVVVRNDDSNSHVVNDNKNGGNNERNEYDLPNKKVDSTKDGYLTGKTAGSNDGWDYTDNERDTEYNSTVTTTNNEMFLDLKRQYMRQITNLIEEFADRFSECFIKVYS